MIRYHIHLLGHANLKTKPVSIELISLTNNAKYLYQRNCCSC